jgi:hypothetical protein
MNKSATTKEELAAILPTMNWYPRVPSDVVTDFLDTIEYVKGHLAHMDYDKIRKPLSASEFLELLNITGTDEEKFKKYSGKFCTGDPAAKYCADGSGYCDPSWCKGH